MSSVTSKRRKEQNEAVFRKYNEATQQSLEAIDKLATDENEPKLRHDDSRLQYFCECSDEACVERIALKPSKYDDIHSKRNRFIIIPGHEAETIERVVSKMPKYWVVEKYDKPPESPSKLKKTDVDNS